MFKGQRYSITASELGLPPGKQTEKDSTPAARQWWQKVLAGAIAPDSTAAPSNPNASVIADLKQRITTAKQLGFHDDVEGLQAKIDLVKKAPKLNQAQLDLIYGRLSKIEVTPTSIKAVERSSEDDIHKDRQRRIKTVEKNRTVKHYLQTFLDFHKQQAKIKGKSLGRYLNLKTQATYFAEWFGEDRPIDEMTDETVTDYFAYCQKLVAKGANPNTIKNQWQVFKQFACETVPAAKIPYMPSLALRKYKIPRRRTEPKPFTIEEVRLLLQEAPEALKTYILLMLNCAYYQGDVADLLAEQVDWTNGRICRARSKTANKMNDEENQPIKINYKLWPETLEAIQKHGNRQGRVFLYNGKPLQVETEASRQDKISKMYGKLIEKLKRHRHRC